MNESNQKVKQAQDLLEKKLKTQTEYIEELEQKV